MVDMRSRGRVAAVLGPTNTGKTHYAIERMLGHRTGVIGLPLRLLAREVYDRIVALRGPSVVALVTGEERIVPDRTQYWVCTVEAMPLEIGADFVAVDEIQLCADPERGHVFTDRLLLARGLHETLFLGAETMRPAIAALIPGVEFLRRERFSQLVYAGSKKVSRMPSRSAIVGFSVENLYAMAELLRRQKGGAAVVMGALSPRTRNAQVELYQNGDVDVLVATDAIGMGLNLDIRHVAFSGLRKFDGRRVRDLWPSELAQIAGRAGRHTQDGSFGVTGEAPMLDPEVAEAIVSHRFAPVRKLMWRNSALDFGSAARLVASLERGTDNEWLGRAREADDVQALKALSARADIAPRLADARAVKLLWDVCRIPDFRGISQAEHAELLGRIFGFLRDVGRVPDDWLAGQVKRIDRAEGDIDTLSKRLAYIRTWTYVAQRNGWVDDVGHWREATRAVEDRLSDALHGALTQRFVDRRTSVLLRRLKQRESLVADVNDQGEVTVEGEVLGRIEGFRFRQDATASPDEARTLRQAALSALRPEFHLRADRMYNAPDPEFDLTEQGGLMWGSMAVGKLTRGDTALKPVAEAFVDEEAGPEVIQKVQRRLQHFVDRRIAALFEPLLAMGRDEAITGLARGVAFRLQEGFGIVPRGEIADDIKALDQESRGLLRKHGVRFGQYTIFLPLLLKPAPTRLRLVLWGLTQGFDTFPESPPPGLVTIPADPGAPAGHDTMAGYRTAGARAIRIDMLERLADLLRNRNARGGFEAAPEMLSISGLTLEQFADLMGGLGYRAERGERVKVKAAPQGGARESEPVAAGAGGAGGAAGATGAGPSDIGTEAGPTEAGPTEAGLTEAGPTEAGTTEAGTTEAAPDAAMGTEPAETHAPESVDEEVLGTAPPTGLERAAAEGAEPGTGSEAGPLSEVEAAADAAGPEAAAQAVADTDTDTDIDTDTGTTSAGEAGAGAGAGAAPETPGPDAQARSGPAPEMEVFYTFIWAPRGRGAQRPRRPEGASDGGGQRRGGDRGRGRGRGQGQGQPQGAGQASGAPDAAQGQPAPTDGEAGAGRGGHRGGQGRGQGAGQGGSPDGERGGERGGAQGGRPHGKGGKRPPRQGGPGRADRPDRPERNDKPKTFSAAPERNPNRRGDTIDPDNPFAILATLRDKT